MKTENLLLSSARSGTNFFLAVYGKCYPRDFVAKEIFRASFDSLPLLQELLGLSEDEIKRLVTHDPKGLWEMIVAACAAAERRALVKIFYYHADRESDLWARFRERTRIVHLIRRNQFDVFVSQNMARQTGRWQEFKSADGTPEPLPRLTIEPAELEAYFDRQKAYVDWARGYFEGADYREVFYEDISGSNEACAAEITRIFGRPSEAKEIRIGLKKQKTVTNAELVENYEAVSHFDRPIF